MDICWEDPCHHLSSQQVEAQINMAWFLGQHHPLYYPLQAHSQICLHSGVKHPLFTIQSKPDGSSPTPLLFSLLNTLTQKYVTLQTWIIKSLFLKCCLKHNVKKKKIYVNVLIYKLAFSKLFDIVFNMWIIYSHKVFIYSSTVILFLINKQKNLKVSNAFKFTVMSLFKILNNEYSPIKTDSSHYTLKYEALKPFKIDNNKSFLLSTKRAH